MANVDYFLPEKRIWIDIGWFIWTKWLKKAFKVKSVRFFDFLVFKMFLYFSELLVEFQLQISGSSERARWDAFFEYSNIYFTFWKAWVITQNILQKYLRIWSFFCWTLCCQKMDKKWNFWLNDAYFFGARFLIKNKVIHIWLIF